MKLTGENRSSREKPVPVPLCPPQIPHGLTQDRTRTSAVRGLPLGTASSAELRVIKECCMDKAVENIRVT